MPTFTIKSLGFAPTGHIDARAIGFRTFIDDEYFQYFTAAISGIDQFTVLRVADGDCESVMWRAGAATAADQIRAAVEEGARSGAIPLADPTQAVALNLNVAKIRERMTLPDSLPESIEEGTVICSFEL